MKINQMNLFESLEENKVDNKYESKCEPLTNLSFESIRDYYNELNNDLSHRTSNDDICTPIECVKTMIDYIPEEFWQRDSISLLDPCAGNGNFGAYCLLKTKADNIYYNELNPIRYKNCKNILNPKNINNEDAFIMSGEFDRKYDLVMANPPYSGGGNKNKSLANDFIELAIDLLNDRGYICYVTPNNWMTFNSKNSTLKKLLNMGSFIVIDNDAKKYFPGVGSSFTIIVWQKNVFNNKTKVINNFLVKDTQEVMIPNDMTFLPLYLSQTIIEITKQIILKGKENGRFFYRCDLHNFTQKTKLSDTQDDVFVYPTIHTTRKTRYAIFKQDIYDKWIIIIPLSTYFVPYVVHNYNTTQSVGYIAFETKKEAEQYIKRITLPWFKLIVHLTRYGNFNNIMVLRHLDFDKDFCFAENDLKEIERLCKKIKY